MGYIILTRLARHKAQVTLYFIGGIASLIAITFIIIMMGKQFKDKTHSENAADAGALAACSVMATGFNYYSDENGYPDGGQSGRQQQNVEFKNAPGTGLTSHDEEQNGDNRGMSGAHEDAQGNPNSAREAFGPDNDPLAIEKSREAANNAEQFGEQNLTEFKEAQDAATDAQRETLEEYHEEAVSMGYKVLFQNAGVHHRLGRLSQKQYEEFQETLEPGAVQSGEPRTFVWVDGAGRFHMVTGIVEIEPVNSVNLRTTGEDYPQLMDQSRESARNFRQSHTNSISAQANHITAINPCLWPIFEPIADLFNLIANSFRWIGQAIWNMFSAGIRSSKVVTSTNIADDEDKVIKRTEDINNSRMVYASCFQFHMGSPIKSIAADIDQMTFYIPVQSMAIASFNYTHAGNISRGGNEDSGSDPRHECGLIAAF
jgi:hypothetical protein